MRYSSANKPGPLPLEGTELPVAATSPGPTSQPPFQHVEYLELPYPGENWKATLENVGAEGWVLCNIHEDVATFARAKR